MDTEILKTFLEVNRTRHFGKAAENLFVSQSAVSARIRLLEDTLGVTVFTRTRNNIEPTPAGRKLLRYAESIVTNWNRARQDIVVEDEAMVPLAVAGAPSLWDIVLQDWLHFVHRGMPEVRLYAEALSHEELVRRLLEGTLDLGFLFEAPQVPALMVREAFRVPLVMVADRPGLGAHEAVADRYIMVDWGTSFAITHARHFPDLPPPRLRVTLGRMAQATLLSCGGAAYLARPTVERELAAGRLHLVGDAPGIERVAYAAYPVATEKADMLQKVLGGFPPTQSDGS